MGYIFIWRIKGSFSPLVSHHNAQYTSTIIETTYDEFNKVLFSPCDRFIVAWHTNYHKISVFSVSYQKIIHVFHSFESIKEVHWVYPTYQNPTQLLIVMNSGHFQLLNITNWKIQSFYCSTMEEAQYKKHKLSITCAATSNNGSGIMIVSEKRWLFYMSFNDPTSRPNCIADLLYERKDDDGNQIIYDVDSIVWSSCSRRLVAKYNKRNMSSGEIDKGEIVGIFAFDELSIFPLGFIIQPAPIDIMAFDVYPLFMKFRENVENGAILAICWNHGFITQHHLLFK